MINRFLTLGAMLAISFLANTSIAQAQMNNKPFSFKGTPDGGIGMSIGGQQAILNNKILGFRPDNLLRSSSGSLLDVVKGPNHSAIVSNEGDGGFLPKYKGSSFRGDNLNMSVGVFNTFFSPNKGRSSGSTIASVHSGAVVSTWTARVVSGGAPVSYLPNNSVENWTALVYASY